MDGTLRATIIKNMQLTLASMDGATSDSVDSGIIQEIFVVENHCYKKYAANFGVHGRNFLGFR